MDPASHRWAPSPDSKFASTRSWPGNVREMRNMIQQCVIMARSDTVGSEHLSINGVESAARLADEASRAGRSDLPRDTMNLNKIERDLVERALDESGWNITQAARVLGVSRDALRYRIEKYGFSRP